MGNKFIEIRDERIDLLKRLGLNPEHNTTWTYKWQSLKDNAKLRGAKCLLSFEDYLSLAISAGFKTPEFIGRKRDQYHMGRIGDIGDYEIGNCRFIPHLDNIKEKRVNGGHDNMVSKLTGRTAKTHEYLKVIGEFQRGQNKNNCDSRLAQSIKMTGRTKETHEGLKTISNRLSKNFIAVSPEGENIIGRNASVFCKKYNLCAVSMSYVFRGIKKSYKGWTGKYMEDKIG